LDGPAPSSSFFSKARHCFGGVEKLAVGGLRLRRALAVLGRLEPAGHVLDGELPEVE